jgi:16S rRNA (uracil1498-N3)-methyltransferase
MDQVIDHCAELGVREIVPVETERTVRHVAKREAKHLRRWRRLAAEASKQCGRTTVTNIAPPRPLDELLVKAGRWDLQLAFTVHPASLPLRTILAEHPEPQSVLYLIGPEGGFEDQEVKRIARADFQLVRLGPSTLRTQVAATAALAAILHHYER